MAYNHYCVHIYLFIQVIHRCCCYLKVIKHDMTTFNESWAASSDSVKQDICHKDNITACLDENGKRLSRVESYSLEVTTMAEWPFLAV